MLNSGGIGLGTFYTEFVKDKNHPSLKTETKLTFYFFSKKCNFEMALPCALRRETKRLGGGSPTVGPASARTPTPTWQTFAQHGAATSTSHVRCELSAVWCQTSVCLYVCLRSSICLLSTAIYMLPSVCSTHCAVMSESAVSCCHLCRCLSTTFCHLSIKLSLCQYNVKCLKVDPKMR